MTVDFLTNQHNLPSPLYHLSRFDLDPEAVDVNAVLARVSVRFENRCPLLLHNYLNGIYGLPPIVPIR